MNGFEFKVWRERHGLTQAEAGAKFNVTRGTIQNWEASTGPLSQLIEQNCEIWAGRLTQIRPDLGPVTLVYADASMFVDPYRPSSQQAKLQQHPHPTNARAVAEARALWGRPDFHNPFILDADGNNIWNFVQLQRVVEGRDLDAPLWRRVAIAIVDETAAEANAKGLIEAVVKAYRDRGVPKDVVMYRDRSAAGEYVYLVSPNAFALCPASFRQIATRIAYCEEPSPGPHLKALNL